MTPFTTKRKTRPQISESFYIIIIQKGSQKIGSLYFEFFSISWHIHWPNIHFKCIHWTCYEWKEGKGHKILMYCLLSAPSYYSVLHQQSTESSNNCKTVHCILYLQKGVNLSSRHIQSPFLPQPTIHNSKLINSLSEPSHQKQKEV